MKETSKNDRTNEQSNRKISKRKKKKDKRKEEEKLRKRENDLYGERENRGPTNPASTTAEPNTTEPSALSGVQPAKTCKRSEETRIIPMALYQLRVPIAPSHLMHTNGHAKGHGGQAKMLRDRPSRARKGLVLSQHASFSVGGAVRTDGQSRCWSLQAGNPAVSERFCRPAPDPMQATPDYH